MPAGSTALKGSAGLVITAVIVVGVLIWLPAARWFLLFAAGRDRDSRRDASVAQTSPGQS